jgi:hypothetical protein
MVQTKVTAVTNSVTSYFFAPKFFHSRVLPESHIEVHPQIYFLLPYLAHMNRDITEQLRLNPKSDGGDKSGDSLGAAKRRDPICSMIYYDAGVSLRSGRAAPERGIMRHGKSSREGGGIHAQDRPARGPEERRDAT